MPQVRWQQQVPKEMADQEADSQKILEGQEAVHKIITRLLHQDREEYLPPQQELVW